MDGVHDKMCGQYFKILRPLIGKVPEGELVCERQDGRLRIRGWVFNANGVFNMLVVWELEDNLERVPCLVLCQPSDEVINIDEEKDAAERGWYVDHPYAAGGIFNTACIF